MATPTSPGASSDGDLPTFVTQEQKKSNQRLNFSVRECELVAQAQVNLTRGSRLRPDGTLQEWDKQAISHSHNVFQQARRDHFKILCDEEVAVKGADVDPAVKEMSRDKRNVQSVHAQWTSMDKCWAATVGAQASAPVDKLSAAPLDYVAGDDSAYDHKVKARAAQKATRSAAIKKATDPFTKAVREACMGSTVSVQPPAATPASRTHTGTRRDARTCTHTHPKPAPPPPPPPPTPTKTPHTSLYT